MRIKSVSAALALTVILSTSALAASQTRRVDPRDSDVNPIEWVVRAYRKVVRALGQPVIPIPSTPTTTTT